MFLDLLRRRRSIRAYTPHPLPPSAIDALREAALRSPTSRGINPWHFIFIDNPELINRIARAKTHGSAFLARAPFMIVVCADETASDVWVEDCSIAAATLHYTATDLGLGSCWVQIRNRQHTATESSEEYLRSILGIPASIRVEAIIGIGLAAEQKPGHPEAELLRARIHQNRYNE
jgi:nitroreductase